jgi:general secretion pathway protein D
MSLFNRLTAVLLVAAMIGPVMPLQARDKKADKFMAEGRTHQEKQEWDAALADYEQALSLDPGDSVYKMAVEKARFEAAQGHVDQGQKVREQGQLGEALLEFQKAYAINPASAVAVQEIKVTQQMIERTRRIVEATGKEESPSERALTPVELAKRQVRDKIDRMLPVPELKPLNPAPINLKMNGQHARIIFETVAKYAGINLLWDPDYQPPQKDTINIDLDNTTIEQALDDAAILTKSFWKPVSSNTIFITNDNPNKRRDYEEQVTKVFYLSNVNTPQEIQEIVNAVRAVADLQRVFPYNSQNAIVIRAEADKIALAEKIIGDLDKPKAEVMIDVLVLEATTVLSRQITAAIASTGLNVPAVFSPRNSITIPSSSTSSSTSSTSTSSSTASTTSTGTTTGSYIPLSSLAHLSSGDFAVTLPGALLQAALSDANTKVLQAPQMRSVDNVKASLKIGDRQPTATGSFQPGIGGVGINPLVNTQFTYIDVGVNVDITPRVHENNEVSMHIELDISNINGTVNLGGIDQPIIGQRKVIQDVRMKEGEVTLLAGLVNQQDTKTMTGIPGLSSIPVLRRLFSGESTNRSRDELMIALVPHVIRRPDVTAENLRGIAVGNATTIHLNYAPRPAEPVAGAPAQPSPQNPAILMPPVTAPPATAPPATAPPATAPPATAPPATAPPATAPPLAPGAPPAVSITDTANQPQPTGRVYMSPPQVNAELAGTFNVGIMLSGGTDVASAPIQIQFDPKVLKLNDVGLGGFFANAGGPPVFTKNIQNDTGTATVQLGLPPGAQGIGGTGVMAVLNFQAVAKGTTTVVVPQLTVRNTQGQVVAAGSPQVTVNVK